MEYLREILSDMRKGENIDLYLTVLLAIVLAILNILQIVPIDWIVPLNLAVLALLSFAILGNRHRLDKLLESPVQGMFIDSWPEKIERNIENSLELWIVGVNLSMTIPTYQEKFEKQLEKGGVMKVLLVDPESDVCEIASRILKPKKEVLQNKQYIQDTLDQLSLLQKFGQVDIRLFDYPPPFNAIMIKHAKGLRGDIYLKQYIYKKRQQKLIIRPSNKEWYDFYEDQISAMWEYAKPIKR